MDVQYGPYSAGEVDHVISVLQEKSVSFLLERDERIEQKEIHDNFNSIVRTETRTSTFLDQSYYILINQIDQERVDDALKKVLGTYQPEQRYEDSLQPPVISLEEERQYRKRVDNDGAFKRVVYVSIVVFVIFWILSTHL